MNIIIRTFKIILLLLFVATYTFGQTRDTKNFIITPQTVVKTNLPKLDSCLFELQGILRERVGQSVIIGGVRASGNSVIELWTDFDLKKEEHYILDISAKKLSIRGATQKAIRRGLEALDKILREETSNTAKKKIAPRRIDNVSESDCP
jgi:hypothetical protein